MMKIQSGPIETCPILARILEDKDLIDIVYENSMHQDQLTSFVDIDNAFVWGDTPQGHEYWAQINAEHHEIFRHLRDRYKIHHNPGITWEAFVMAYYNRESPQVDERRFKRVI